MDDREMLEWAAKAAGYLVCQPFRNGEFRVCGQDGRSFAWNPRDDDGDALRLAVKLNMGISIHTGHCSAVAQVGFFCEERGKDTEVTTRRAIVRAAAEIGKSIP